MSVGCCAYCGKFSGRIAMAMGMCSAGFKYPGTTEVAWKTRKVDKKAMSSCSTSKRSGTERLFQGQPAALQRSLH